MSDAERVKILVLGQPGVGKSSLCSRFIHDYLVEEYDPTIEDWKSKMAIVDNKEVKIEIFDPAGCEDYFFLRDQWIRESDSIILCISPDCEESSLIEIKSSYQRILHVLHPKTHECNLAICIAANKCDLNYKESFKMELHDLADQWGCELIFNSSKDAVNTETVIHHAVREYRKPQGKRGTWASNVCKIHAVELGLRGLDFPDTLIEVLLYMIFSEHCIIYARNQPTPPSKKACRCSIM